MPFYLGIDTSNYTTSCALYNVHTKEMLQNKTPLQVADKSVGLRQSDAVFQHVKALEATLGGLLTPGTVISGVGVSVRPRDIAGSYMPCFLVGEMAAGVIASTSCVPKYKFSHQAGHISAALYATGNTHLLNDGSEFVAFHVSGGTTECLHVCSSANGFEIEILAQSEDLFAGQAIDRVGSALGIKFPAGKGLEELALKSDKVFAPKPTFKDGNPCISGLQNQCEKMISTGERAEDTAAYCLAYIKEVILKMTDNAAKKYPGRPVIYAGGVMSNSIIRTAVTEKFGGFFASPQYSADNAAGIALMAAFSAGEKL